MLVQPAFEGHDFVGVDVAIEQNTTEEALQFTQPSVNVIQIVR